jgi:hypothetical protein
MVLKELAKINPADLLGAQLRKVSDNNNRYKNFF